MLPFTKILEENFISPSYPKHLKIIHWNKKWYKFLFAHFFAVPQKEVSKQKIYVIFPPYSRLWLKGLRLFSWTPNLCHLVSLTIEIHKNNADNSRVANKQYYKSFYQTKLTFSVSYCKILQTLSREIVPDNTSFSHRCEFILYLYWLG